MKLLLLSRHGSRLAFAGPPSIALLTTTLAKACSEVRRILWRVWVSLLAVRSPCVDIRSAGRGQVDGVFVAGHRLQVAGITAALVFTHMMQVVALRDGSDGQYVGDTMRRHVATNAFAIKLYTDIAIPSAAHTSGPVPASSCVINFDALHHQFDGSFRGVSHRHNITNPAPLRNPQSAWST